MPVLVDRLYQEGWGDLLRWAGGPAAVTLGGAAASPCEQRSARCFCGGRGVVCSKSVVTMRLWLGSGPSATSAAGLLLYLGYAQGFLSEYWRRGSAPARGGSVAHGKAWAADKAASPWRPGMPGNMPTRAASAALCGGPVECGDWGAREAELSPVA